MIKTQDVICYYMRTQSESEIMSLVSKRVNWLKRESRRRSFSSVRVGEKRLLKMTDKCHAFRVKFVYFRDKLSMMQNVSLIEREC
jgi:hypothetical protein